MNILLQDAMNDVDAEYQTIDTTTVIAAEGRSIPNKASGTASPATGAVQAKFIRAVPVSP